MLDTTRPMRENGLCANRRSTMIPITDWVVDRTGLLNTLG